MAATAEALVPKKGLLGKHLTHLSSEIAHQLLSRIRAPSQGSEPQTSKERWANIWDTLIQPCCWSGCLHTDFLAFLLSAKGWVGVGDLQWLPSPRLLSQDTA